MNDQRSVSEQLQDLIQLANKAGLYDAADCIKVMIEKTGYENHLKRRTIKSC